MRRFLHPSLPATGCGLAFALVAALATGSASDPSLMLRLAEPARQAVTEALTAKGLTLADRAEELAWVGWSKTEASGEIRAGKLQEAIRRILAEFPAKAVLYKP